MFLNGGETHSGAPAKYTAAFVATGCTVNATGEDMAGPPGRYYLAEENGSPVLYEVEPSGEGAIIRNGWLDGGGTHFFVWVTSGPGYLFSFPRDSAAPPVRHVYAAGAFQVVKDEHGRVRPKGSPGADCPMRAEGPAS